MDPTEIRFNALGMAHHEYMEAFITKDEVIGRANLYTQFINGDHEAKVNKMVFETTKRD